MLEICKREQANRRVASSASGSKIGRLLRKPPILAFLADYRLAGDPAALHCGSATKHLEWG